MENPVQKTGLTPDAATPDSPLPLRKGELVRYPVSGAPDLKTPLPGIASPGNSDNQGSAMGPDNTLFSPNAPIRSGVNAIRPVKQAKTCQAQHALGTLHDHPIAPPLAHVLGPPWAVQWRIEPKSAESKGLLVCCDFERDAGHQAGSEAA